MSQVNEDKSIDFSGAFNKSQSGGKGSGMKEIEHFRYSKSPKVVWWVVRYSCGLVKSEKQANYVLITFAVAAITFALVFVSSNFSNKIESPSRDIINLPQLEEGYVPNQ